MSQNNIKINPVDIFFSKGNINALYSAVQTHLATKFNITIGRDYLREMLDIMKFVVKPIKRVPTNINIKEFVTTLNKQTLREAIPVFEKSIQGEHNKQPQQPQQPQQKVQNSISQFNPSYRAPPQPRVVSDVPQPSHQSGGQRQNEELDTLYAQIAQQRSPLQGSQTPSHIDFTKVGNTPQINDPKFNTNIDQLYNKASNYRQQGRDVSIDPPTQSKLNQLPFQTTEHFQLSSPPIYQHNSGNSGNSGNSDKFPNHSMQFQPSQLSQPSQNNFQASTQVRMNIPDGSMSTSINDIRERDNNEELSVDNIYSRQDSSQSTFNPEQFANGTPRIDRNVSYPVQTHDYTKVMNSMNNFSTIPPQPQQMRVLIPKTSRNTTSAQKSNIIPVNISIDSRNKDPTQEHNNYRISIDEIKDVLSIELTDAQIPISEYTINTTNNIVYFEETDGITKIAEITPGNYNPTNLATEIETLMTTVGASVYTVAVDTLQNKFVFNSDGAGGTGIFNLLFDGGTETIGFEREKPIYIERSIGEVIGFDIEDQSGSLMYTSQMTYNLKGEKYILLYVKEADLIKTKDSNVKNAFAKIVLDKELGETKFYNRNIDNKFIKYFSPAIGRLAYITIEFRKQNGELYDFNGQHNSLSFELITKDITTSPYRDGHSVTIV